MGMNIKATNKVIKVVPQVLSMSFDKNGKCYKFTGGYAVDRSTGSKRKNKFFFFYLKNFYLIIFIFVYRYCWFRWFIWYIMGIR